MNPDLDSRKKVDLDSDEDLNFCLVITTLVKMQLDADVSQPANINSKFARIFVILRITKIMTKSQIHLALSMTMTH